MIQPFITFERQHLERLISLKRTYIVSQAYTRGFNHLAEIHRTDILLTDYEDPGLAKVHLNALKHDKFAAMIDLQKPAHLNKIKDMMQGDDYALYWSVVKSADELRKKLDAGYKARIRRYLETKTTWQVPAGENVKVQFEVIFGELHVVLKWRRQAPRIKFSEIERL